jgi:hypothetical protein
MQSKRTREGKTKNSYHHLHLAYANMEGMNGKEEEILRETDRLENMPDIIAATETWEDIEATGPKSMEGYTWIGNPIEKNPGATRNHGGTGAWVRNKVLNRVSKLNAKHHHKDIMWLKVIGNRRVMYIAVIYSNPRNIDNHKLILETMRKNEEHLEKTGAVVAVGDFNSRLNEITGDKNKHPSNYDRAMRSFLNKSNLEAATNEGQIREEKHWTFIGRQGGRSVNDYLLAPTGTVRNYKVHQDVNFGSQHRLITASLAIPHDNTQ